MRLALAIFAIFLAVFASAGTARAQGDTAEVSFWESVRDSNNRDELEAYLKAYPQGQFAPLARIRIGKLKSGGTSAPAPSATQAVAPAKASPPGPPVHDCDLLAASPSDTSAVAAGIEFSIFDAVSAEKSCRQAVSGYPGVARFEFQLGRALSKLRRYKEAIDHYENASRQGHGVAAQNIAFTYYRAAPALKDYAKALVWYLKAVELGSVPAMRIAGFMYERGLGTQQNYGEAIRLYRMAAGQQDGKAMFNLGIAYQRGRGVAKDERSAAEWYRKAAGRGSANAMLNLALLYRKGRGVARSEAESLQWMQRAAEHGQSTAMFSIGLAYVRGQGVPKDPRKARDWWLKAVEMGNPAPLSSLALIYDRGMGGLDKDPEMAAAYMLRALKAGKSHAQKQMTGNANAYSSAFRRALQRLMKLEGFYQGTVDGKFGSGTRRAIEALVQASIAAGRRHGATGASNLDLGDVRDLGKF